MIISPIGVLALLGNGENNFYAEPAVDHLSMWRSPQTVQGWWVDPSVEAGFSSKFASQQLNFYIHAVKTL